MEMQHPNMKSPSAPVLPIQLLEALGCIGSKLEQGQSIESELGCVLRELNNLPAETVVRAEREISSAAKLHRYRRRPKLFTQWLWARPSDIERLEREAGLEYLFIFHMDGTVREAALNKIASGLPSPFMFAGVAWRLNDWALPVRIAAAECAERVFPLTAADVIARAAIALLARENSWGRWTSERAVLVEALHRSDVALALADVLIKRQTGRLTAVLQRALQNSGLDSFLEQIAREAAQPAVRAVALQSLIDGYASWPSGLAWQWIDKSMGIRKRVRTFDRRPLTKKALLKPLIMMGAVDRSAAVKKVALDCLTRHRAEMPDAKEIAAPLLLDRTASVRERAEFLLTIIAEAK